MPTLLRDLISIPERVLRGDFVMNLAQGVNDSAGTLQHYVVTDDLVRAFDNALGFISSAVRENESKAAYLDGSFGAGKSHFMAVLHLILQKDPGARGVPELADTIARHDPVLGDAQFELVPVHMIGADSMEQRIFSSYVDHVQREHPEARLPGVFADGPLFEQAERTREAEGDDAFLARLNEGAADEAEAEGWGDLAGAWTLESYDRARNADVADAERARLRGAVVEKLLPGFREAMRGSVTGYVDLDSGLAELSRHSQELGADALILFLDELILWLGSRIADQAFVTREGQKLTKLIEYTADRSIPIVSFVARQRDLSEFVGDQLPGAERVSFADTLRYWEARFHTVELHDRDLPKIAERRLLTPVSEAARQELDQAFRETERTRPEVLDVLMTEDGNRDQFRSTYPFSPAFMKTLVAASSALQRERTALRVMLELLVDGRDELIVGDLVSVGYLFDVLAKGNEPFSQDMKRLFDQAQELHATQLRPVLLAEMPGATAPAPEDDRLMKTLLLAALVPLAAPLRNLDVAKLTALNHGSIAAPIPGQEKTLVLGKLRRWSSQVGALKVGDDPHNPSVGLRLTGVDVETIIERAQSVDNTGERRQLVKALVLSQLGIETDTRLFSEHTVLWRGTRRAVDVVFGNVRDTDDLPDEALVASDDRWKVVIDYPFDQGHSPHDDLDRLDRWREAHGASRTVCWIPAFFSQDLQRDLKRLVIIRHVLSGERLAQYTDHLSPQDRNQAAGMLEDLRSALEQRVAAAIRQAYGVERAAQDTIDASHGIEDRLQSLQPGFSPQVSVGAQLDAALDGLVDQMLASQFPDHPHFEGEVRTRDLKVVLEEVERAVLAPDGRIEVPRDRRGAMNRIATPLKLGVQHEAPFLLGQHWKDVLDRAISLARRCDGEERTITVGDMRDWIEESASIGLTRDVQSLVVMAYAAQTGRTFREHGGPAAPTIDRLDDALELVTAVLPHEASWRAVVERSASILGLASVNPALNPSSFGTLVARLREVGNEHREATAELVPVLEARLELLGIPTDDATRLKTAKTGAELVQIFTHTGDDGNAIHRFAALEVPSTEAALGKSVASAAQVLASLTDPRWDVIELVTQRAQAGDAAFRAIVDELATAIKRDEFVEAIEQALAHAAAAGLALLRPDAPPPPPSPPPQPPDGGGTMSCATVPQAQAKLAELAEMPEQVVVDLSWRPAGGE